MAVVKKPTYASLPASRANGSIGHSLRPSFLPFRIASRMIFFVWRSRNLGVEIFLIGRSGIEFSILGCSTFMACR